MKIFIDGMPGVGKTAISKKLNNIIKDWLLTIKFLILLL